jgi:hypothetical protein
VELVATELGATEAGSVQTASGERKVARILGGTREDMNGTDVSVAIERPVTQYKI